MIKSLNLPNILIRFLLQLCGPKQDAEKTIAGQGGVPVPTALISDLHTVHAYFDYIYL